MRYCFVALFYVAVIIMMCVEGIFIAHAIATAQMDNVSNQISGRNFWDHDKNSHDLRPFHVER